MNILIINHYAGSPAMGMEYRPYYMARYWVQWGHHVTILAADHSHIRQSNPVLESDFSRENIDGIQYIWVKTPAYQGNGLARVRNIFTFVSKLWVRASRLARVIKPDVVVASSTYPSDNYIARKIANKAKAKYIYEVHDLWPLSPMELGNMSKYHPFIMAMQHGENFAYKHADAVISMLPKTLEHMKSHGLDPDKWFYVPNGINVDEWETPKGIDSPIFDKSNDIRAKYLKTVAYAGTYGLANGLDSFVLAAKKLNDVAFILIGKGPEKVHLESMAQQEKLNNVYILGSVAKSGIPGLLDLFDYLYIGLKRESLFRFGISPNKMIDYMMAGKPIIQAIDAGNNMVEEAQCGIHVQPENPQAIAGAIEELNSLTAAELQQMGKNGQNFVLKHHDYKVLAKKMIDIFNL